MNKHQIGDIGEKKAMEILDSLGFDNVEKAKSKFLPYDILAKRNGIKFTINVKYTQGIDFTVHWNNLSRLDSKGYSPALLFIKEKAFYFFVLNNTNQNKSQFIENEKTILFTHCPKCGRKWKSNDWSRCPYCNDDVVPWKKNWR